MPPASSPHQLREENRLLHKIVEILGSAWELEKILNQVIRLVTELTRADGCFLYLYDPGHHDLLLRASKNPRPEAVGRIRLKLGEGITGWVARSKRAVFIPENAWQDSRFKLFQGLPEDRYEAFLSVPVSFKGKMIGVINVQHRKPKNKNPGRIKLLQTIAGLVAGAIENARLHEESQKKSLIIQGLSEDLETRKRVERAKGVLMQKRGWSEAESFRWIQKESMIRRRPMREIAESVLSQEV